MVPKLRFSEFNKVWQQNKIGDVFTIFSGFAFKSTDATTSGCRWLKIADVGCQVMTPNTPSFLPSHFRNEYHKFLIRKDDYVVALTRPILNGKLKIAIAGKEYDGSLLNQRVGKIVTKNNPKFVYSLLQMESTVSKINNCIAGTDPPNLSTQDIKDMVVFVPIIEEQTKIADFLSSVDKKIALLNQQYDLLCQYKKGMMQKIFSQELRFKHDSGDEFPEWEEVELKKIASKVNTKNRDNLVTTVLTNSATQGIVSQESYFEREIVTESNLTGYYVVRVGDFVYNPRISSTAPVGPIKMNELTQGIMSPLYTVFRFEKGFLKFYQYFFESSVWHDYMKSVANSGARHDRMNISGADFFGLPIPQPSEEEQTKIARFLSAIDDKITTKKAELDKLKTWKQGLLQQMFV
ncbi:restriction endonuclease subunit S [Klebsiella quasipneumoniae]|uniref:restriction endonuclease subunit S n=1 Tax=Klebsiella quasipneumoniae TaxID=1463165 RepID=UPI002ABB0750|nr:restriction endonuclease subunit S [Klebsiella quasipneumoniae]MDZ1773825.1 restriction endonuclease subunit S [Klebsiella quasipneumoniae]